MNCECTNELLLSALSGWQHEFLTKNRDNRAYLRVKCANLNMVWLYDPGAMISAINHAKYIQLTTTFPKQLVTHRLTGVGGAPLTVTGLPVLKLNVAGQEVEHPVHAVSRLTSEGVLGMDLIRRLNVCFDPANLKPVDKEATSLHCMSAVSLEPGEYRVVPCSFFSAAKCSDFIADGNSPVFIPSALIKKPEPGHETLVPMCNITEQTVHLARGHRVGNISPAVVTVPAEAAIASLCKPAKQVAPLDPVKRKYLLDKLAVDHLSNFWAERLQLLVLEFHDVFSAGKFDLGLARNYTHSVQMLDDNPVFVKQFRLPETHREAVLEHVEELMKLGVLRHTKSRYNSPIFCVPKRNGQLRTVVDFRRVNERSVPHFHSGLTVDEAIDHVARLKASVFSSLDLTSGFYQMPLAESSRHLTAFTVPGVGSYEYTTTPMGLTSAPAGFWSLMTEVCRGLPASLCYLDDILTSSPDNFCHLQDLRQVFTRLRAHNLKQGCRCVFLCFSPLLAHRAVLYIFNTVLQLCWPKTHC